MKAKTLGKMGLIAGVLVSSVLATGCTPAVGSKKMDASKQVEAKAEAFGIVSKPGYYQDKNIGFTFTWPAQVMSKPAKKYLGEVLRWTGDKGIPAITLTVRDKSENAVPLEEMPRQFKEKFESMLKPGKNFELVEGKIAATSNGVPAAYARVNWEIGKEAFALVTVSLTVYKGDKMIIVTCTTPQGMPPTAVIDSWVKALKVEE
ncbi:MAG: hypothetical protein GY866_07660 [Proteobacteria bacterium]|nr:hypothetical protein [Pseudomonadota bacterium]